MIVKNFRLVNGENIFATVCKENRRIVQLLDPMILEEVATQEGTIMTLFPYAPLTKDAMVTFKKKDILTSFLLPIPVVQFYINSLQISELRSKYNMETINSMNIEMENTIARYQAESYLKNLADSYANSPIFVHNDSGYIH